MSETILLHAIVSYNSLFHMLRFRNGSTNQFYWCYTRPVRKRPAIKSLATERTRKFVVSIQLQKLKKGNWMGCCKLHNLLKLLYNLWNMLYYSFSFLSYNIDLHFSFSVFFFFLFRMPLWWITILSSAGGFWLVCRLLLNICRCWNLVS